MVRGRKSRTEERNCSKPHCSRPFRERGAGACVGMKQLRKNQKWALGVVLEDRGVTGDKLQGEGTTSGGSNSHKLQSNRGMANINEKRTVEAVEVWGFWVKPFNICLSGPGGLSLYCHVTYISGCVWHLFSFSWHTLLRVTVTLKW